MTPCDQDIMGTMEMCGCQRYMGENKIRLVNKYNHGTKDKIVFAVLRQWS